MSIPIRTCDYPKALDSVEAFDELVEKAMQPIYSVINCTCNPPCRVLNENEKKMLQELVNEKIMLIRYEEAAKRREPMSLENMCEFSAKYLLAKTGETFSAEDVYNMSPSRNSAYYLELYEEAVYATGKDFYGRSAIDYFNERFLTTKGNLALKVLASRYYNAMNKLRNGTAK